jgi:Histidine kinase-like ATPase domain
MAVPAPDIDVADGAPVAELCVTAPFDAGADAPRRARRLVVDALRQWGAADRLVGDVALLVSELATNAVRHADSCFSVTVRTCGATLRIAVRDGAPLAGTAHEAWLIPQPLHGLSVVDALCLRWGVEDTRHGKIVWAELPYESAQSPRPAPGD